MEGVRLLVIASVMTTLMDTMMKLSAVNYRGGGGDGVMDSVKLNRLKRLGDGAVRAVVERGTEVVSRRVGGGGEGGTCYTDRACLNNSRDHSSHRDSGDNFADRDWRHQGSSGHTQAWARDCSVEACTRDHSVEACTRDHSVEAGAGYYSVEAGARDYSVEAGARDHSVEAGAGYYPGGA